MKFPFYYILPIFWSAPILGLVLLRGIIETTSKLTYIGNFTSCLQMTFNQIAELSFVTLIHFYLFHFLSKYPKFPMILLNAFFTSVYGHIAFFQITDYNVGLNGMQFINPSAYQLWVKRIGSYLDHFTVPIYSIPKRLKLDMSIKLMLEVMKVKFNFYVALFVVSFLLICLSLYILYWYRLYIINSSFMGMFLLAKLKGKKVKNVEGTPVRTTTLSEINNGDKSNIPNGQEIENGNNEENGQTPEMQIQDETIEIKANNKTKCNKILIALHILSVIYIGTILYVLNSKLNMKSIYYSKLSCIQSAVLSFSHFDKQLTQEVSDNLVNYVREYLPPGRRWLDAREKPVFPAVHSDMETFCAYNKNHSDCANYKPSPKVPLVKQLPNVLFIVYESFTPGTYLIDDEFIIEHASREENDTLRYVTNTKYYNSWIMKHFNKIQDYAVTFSGMSSLGIPTASGFHSLMTGMYPSQSFYNILDGSLLHSDDFPSMMKQYGYRNLWISAAGYNFDCINLWVFRRSAKEEAMNRLQCKEAFGDLIDDELQQKLVGKKVIDSLKTCDSKRVDQLTKKLKKRGLDFPKWFDYAFYYSLTKENAELLSLPQESAMKKTMWASDRVSTSQLITHWKQQKEFMKKNIINSPLFGGIITTDSHFEFFGYDKSEFYDYVVNRKYLTREEWNRERFIRVNKYADKYVGKLLEWIKENDPNTIFVLTGDHAVRKVPIYEQDDTVIDDVVYSSDCVHHSSGCDSFFVTSGMIGYFGDDPKVKEVMHLDKIKGKTMKLPTDHNDLVYTVEDILNKLNGTEMQPTHRRNRNLMDLTYNIVEHSSNGTLKEGIDEIDKSKWKGYSFNHYNIDYREGTNLLRVHPADVSGAHFYTKASYPQCLKRRDRYQHILGSKEAYQAFERLQVRYAAENHLTATNTLYHYDFRNESCVKEGHCEFPVPGEYEMYYDRKLPMIWLLSIIKVAVIIWIVVEAAGLIVFAVNKMRNKNYFVL